MKEEVYKFGCAIPGDPIQGHEYAERFCPQCGADFCYACCGGQNVDQGGKYVPDFMLCPQCGHNYYEE